VFVSAQVIRTIATPGAAAAAHSMSTVGSLEQEQPGFCGSRTVTELRDGPKPLKCIKKGGFSGPPLASSVLVVKKGRLLQTSSWSFVQACQ
jgi:hypothetical protein